MPFLVRLRRILRACVLLMRQNSRGTSGNCVPQANVRGIGVDDTIIISPQISISSPMGVSNIRIIYPSEVGANSL